MAPQFKKFSKILYKLIYEKYINRIRQRKTIIKWVLMLTCALNMIHHTF